MARTDIDSVTDASRQEVGPPQSPPSVRTTGLSLHRSVHLWADSPYVQVGTRWPRLWPAAPARVTKGHRRWVHQWNRLHLWGVLSVQHRGDSVWHGDSPRVAELCHVKIGIKKSHGFGLPGCPVVKTLHFQRGGRGYFPWKGAKIPLAMLRLRMPWQPKWNRY